MNTPAHPPPLCHIRPPFRRAGFSLLEVVSAIGLFSLCAVSLLGLVSFALEGVATSSTESRAIHLASTLFATLKATPFQEVDCFGTTIDLSTAGPTEPLALYAYFPPDGLPVITSEPEEEASGYRLELHFEPITVAPHATVTASRISLTVHQLHGPRRSGVPFQTIIADL